MGNHPSVDLMVTSPEQVSFGIDVKGLYKRTYWLVKPKPLRTDLFYVFAFVPDEDRNRFFVMSQAEVNGEIAAELEKATQRALLRGASPEKAAAFPCVSWKAAEMFEDRWKTLPP